MRRALEISCWAAGFTVAGLALFAAVCGAMFLCVRTARALGASDDAGCAATLILVLATCGVVLGIAVSGEGR